MNASVSKVVVAERIMSGKVRSTSNEEGIVSVSSAYARRKTDLYEGARKSGNGERAENCVFLTSFIHYPVSPEIILLNPFSIIKFLPYPSAPQSKAASNLLLYYLGTYAGFSQPLSAT
jgi:hypothetical protein